MIFIYPELNCPDPIIYNGELPPNCYWLNLYGGVRICEPMCPTSPSNQIVSVAQPLSYMCDKLGSFNPRYIYNEGRIPACGGRLPSVLTVFFVSMYPLLLGKKKVCFR